MFSEKYIDLHTHSSENDIDIFSIKNYNAFEDFDIESPQKYSVGMHPWFLSYDTKEDGLNNLEKISGYPKVMAIGEIGLDRFSETDFNLQIENFIKQIAIAEKRKLPIIIHCVRAFSDLIAIKKKLNPKVPLIIHGFNQNFEILSELIKHQFYLSVGDAIFNEKYNAHKLLKNIPENRLFLETDNSKISIKKIYTKASEILQKTEKELIKIINQNFQAVFQHNI
jgi:TatD DNase family protein